MTEQPAADALAALLEAVVSPVVERAVRKAVEESIGAGQQRAEKYLSASEIAKRLGVARSTVHEWIETQGLPAYKVGVRVFISEPDFARWMETKRYAVAGETAWFDSDAADLIRHAGQAARN